MPGQGAKDPPGLTQEPRSIQHRLVSISPYFAEFIGCMLMALAWNSIELGKVGTNEPVSLLPMLQPGGVVPKHGQATKGSPWKPLVLGLTSMVATYSFASVSGAHLNPAVSLTVGLSSRGDWHSIWKYMVMQFAGAIAGVSLSRATYNKPAHGTLIGARNGEGIIALLLVELAYTVMLCFVFMNVTLSRRNNPVKAGNQFYALAIGLAMVAACSASDDISGAFFNPALAVAVDTQSPGFGQCMIYLVVQVFAAFLAAVIYRVVRSHEAEANYEKWVASEEEEKETINAAKLISEALGTGLVVITFGMTALSKSYKMLRPLAAGAALTSMHYAVSDVSGGYFNPAVTFATFLNGRNQLALSHGIAYLAAQIVSAGVCSIFVTVMNGHALSPMVPEAKFSVADTGSVGLIFSFAVCYAFLATKTVVGIDTKLARNNYHGLAYGLASAAGGFALLHLSNALANPALMLGEGFTASVSRWWQGESIVAALVAFAHSSFYAASYFLGAVLASFTFRLTHASVYSRCNGPWKDESTPLLHESPATA